MIAYALNVRRRIRIAGSDMTVCRGSRRPALVAGVRSPEDARSATRLNPSNCRSHPSSRFQLAKCGSPSHPVSTIKHLRAVATPSQIGIEPVQHPIARH
jgi:hypothetical protein